MRHALWLFLLLLFSVPAHADDFPIDCSGDLLYTMGRTDLSPRPSDFSKDCNPYIQRALKNLNGVRMVSAPIIDREHHAHIPHFCPREGIDCSALINVVCGKKGGPWTVQEGNYYDPTSFLLAVGNKGETCRLHFIVMDPPRVRMEGTLKGTEKLNHGVRLPNGGKGLIKLSDSVPHLPTGIPADCHPQTKREVIKYERIYHDHDYLCRDAIQLYGAQKPTPWIHYNLSAKKPPHAHVPEACAQHGKEGNCEALLSALCGSGKWKIKWARAVPLADNDGPEDCILDLWTDAELGGGNWKQRLARLRQLNGKPISKNIPEPQ